VQAAAGEHHAALAIIANRAHVVRNQNNVGVCPASLELGVAACLEAGIAGAERLIDEITFESHRHGQAERHETSSSTTLR